MGDLAQAEVLWGMRVGGRQAVRNLCARGREGCCRGPNFLVHSAVISSSRPLTKVPLSCPCAFILLFVHSFLRSPPSVCAPSCIRLLACSLSQSPTPAPALGERLPAHPWPVPLWQVGRGRFGIWERTVGSSGDYIHLASLCPVPFWGQEGRSPPRALGT